VASALVVLSRGELLAYVARGRRAVQVFVEANDLGKERALREALTAWFGRSNLPAWLVESVDGKTAVASTRAPLFEAMGFVRTSDGLRLLRQRV
jgi:hypothetical protein